MSGSPDDAELVGAARSGDTRAFMTLVDRYQRLVCAVAFDITGNLLQSEEIGQEVFLVSWSRLHEMRDPRRFRNWICGIARRLGWRFQRELRLRPPAQATALRAAQEIPSADPSPLERIITREEEGVVWRALGQIPEPYRLALALYYREEQSIKRVASVLHISEAVVEKRLSRGRRLLQREVLGLMESGLGGRPGRSFGVKVGAAIAALGLPEPARAAPQSSRTHFRAGGAAGVMGIAAFWVAAFVDFSGAAAPPGFSSAALSSVVALPRKPPPPTFSEDVFHAGAAAIPGTGLADPVQEYRDDFLALDFEDGLQPRMLMDAGMIVSSVCAPGSRFCAMATHNITYRKSAVVLYGEGQRAKHIGGLLRYYDDLVIAFDYWVGAGPTSVGLHMFNDERKINFMYWIEEPRHEGWTHVEVPFSKFVPDVKGTPPQDTGDRIDSLWIYLPKDRVGPHLYVDNVRIARK